MASPTWWTWVWASSRGWWWTGKPGMLQSLGSQKVGHDWVTELNWTELNWNPSLVPNVGDHWLYFYQTVRGIHITGMVPSSNDSLKCHWLNIRLCLDAELCKWKKGRGYSSLWPFIPRAGPSTLFSSVAQLCPTLRPHGLQHSRLPCLSPTPGAYSDSCPLSQWCHATISPSVIPFSSCLQSSPASGSFPRSQRFASGGQSIGASASASILPMNIQDWFPLGWTGWISLQSKGLSKTFSNTTVQKHQFFGAQLTL